MASLLNSHSLSHNEWNDNDIKFDSTGRYKIDLTEVDLAIFSSKQLGDLRTKGLIWDIQMKWSDRMKCLQEIEARKVRGILGPLKSANTLQEKFMISILNILEIPPLSSTLQNSRRNS